MSNNILLQGIVHVDIRYLTDTMECTFEDEIVSEDVFQAFRRHFSIGYSVERGAKEDRDHSKNSVVIEYNGGWLETAKQLEHLLRGQFRMKSIRWKRDIPGGTLRSPLLEEVE